MQIDAISPTGQTVRFALDPATGIANIGRNQTNEIVLDDPSVAEFHAFLDHREPSPHRITSFANTPPIKVNGVLLTPGASVTLSGADTVEIGRYQLLIAGQRQGVVDAQQAVTGTQVGGAATFANGDRLPQTGAYATTGSLVAGFTTGDTQAYDDYASEVLAAGTQAHYVGAPSPSIYNPETDDAADSTQSILINILGDRTLRIEAGETAIWRVEIINGGLNVGPFVPQVEAWNGNQWISLPANVDQAVQIIPPEANLDEGQDAKVTIELRTTRHPQSWAGFRRLRIKVQSTSYPGRVASRGIALYIRPFLQFSVGRVVPQRKTIAFGTRTCDLQIPVHNQSNYPVRFDVTGNEREQACTFAFGESEAASRLGGAEFELKPDAVTQLQAHVTPKERRRFGNQPKKYDLSFAVGQHQQPQSAQTTQAELTHKTWMPYWVLGMFAFLIATFLFGIIVWATIPRVEESKSLLININGVMDNDTRGSQEAHAGDQVDLVWDVTRFGGLAHIDRLELENGSTTPILPLVPSKGVEDISSDVIEQVTSSGSKIITYKITVQHWLSRLPLMSGDWLDNLSRQAEDTLEIQPIAEERVNSWLTLDVNPLNILPGESVQIQWNVNNEEDQNLAAKLRGSDGTELSALSGDETVFPEFTTTYTLTVDSSLGESSYLSATVNVRYPPPVGTFDATPRRVNVGQEVAITWNIVDADIVEIAGATSMPITTTSEPAIHRVKFEQPGKYLLNFKAINRSVNPGRSKSGIQDDFAPIEIDVLKPGTVTNFRVFPAEVVLGDPDADNVQLSWRVDADQAEIEILRDGERFDSGLSNTGTKKLDTVTEGHSFELVVRNLDDSVDFAVAELAVIIPTPTPEPPTPEPTATIPPPEIKQFEIANQDTVVTGEEFTILWTITGVFSRIEITSPDYPTIISTEQGGDRLLSDAKPSAFTLTVFRDNTQVAKAAVTLQPLPLPPLPPSIASFSASGQSVRLVSSDKSSASYVAEIGEDITLSWQADNADEVTLKEIKSGEVEFSGLGVSQSLERRLTQNVTYILTAQRETVNSDAYTIRIEVNAPEPPPPPKNIDVQIVTSPTVQSTQAVVTWDYTGNPDSIVGFRVYRADIGSAEFTRKADEFELTRTKTEWIDERPDRCEKVYYVVGVYEDKGQDPPVKQETASSESYQTLACPE